MNPKLSRDIYKNPHVAASCERAKCNKDFRGEEWAVWIDDRTADKEYPRMFSGPSDDPIGGEHMVCIFDTADGGELL